MATFAEEIAESFESVAELKWKVISSSHATATFEVGNAAFEVSFEQREPAGPWHVGFSMQRGMIQPWQAFRTFNGVFQAVGEFVETREPERVAFISKDEDLESVYATYLRRHQPKMESLGYKLEGPHKIDPYTEYTLRRTTPSSWRSS
jgi:hypothetical protein